MRIKSFIVYGLLLLALAFSGAVFAEGPTDAVAIVNGEPILRGEFLTVLEQTAGQQILDQMINLRLVIQSGRQLKLVDPKTIEAGVAQIKGQFQSDQEFQEALAKNRITLAQLSEQIEAKTAMDLLTVKDVVVTPEEVKAYFEANKDSLGQPEQVHARHILFLTGEGKDEAAVKAKAEETLAKLKGGADFAAFAKELSEDPGSKESGGDLGFFQRGELVQEFENAAFALQPGEMSGLVKTQYGYHIITVMERKDAATAKFEEREAEIRNLLIGQKAKQPAQVIEELRSQANIQTLWSAQAK